jgi:heme/copper-type cytochrome/quinol oxidase subunit 2
MVKANGTRWIGAVLIVAAGALLPALAPSPKSAPQTRVVDVVARKYAYDPPIIKVNQGDEIHIHFGSKDVEHGFYLEGYDVDALADPGKDKIKLRHPSQFGDYNPADEIVIKADKRGKFRYRCSITCGYMHPFMMGVLLVEPNTLFGSASGLMVGLLFGGFLLAWPKAPAPQVAKEAKK